MVVACPLSIFWIPTAATESRIAITAITAMISIKVKPERRREDGIMGAGCAFTGTSVLLLAGLWGSP